MRFIVQAQLNLELETIDLKKAEEEAAEKFREIEKSGVKIENARFVDRGSGYFLK